MPNDAAPPPPDFTLDEIGRLARLPFRRAGALRRWTFGLVAAAVPFIGPLALAGYQLRILRKTMASERATLPEMDRSGMLFLEGVPVAVVSWLCRLPAGVLVFVSLADAGGSGGFSWPAAALALAGFTLLPGALLWIAGRSDLRDVVRRIGERSSFYLRLIVILGLMFLLSTLILSELLASSGSPAGQTMDFLQHPVMASEPVENWPSALAGWLAGCATRFWFATLEAALIGTAGRRMGLRPGGTGPLRIFGR